jgi:hypothetical protein
MAGRALRVAAASGIVLGVLAPTAAFAADYPGGTTGTHTDPGSQVAAKTSTQVAAKTSTNSSTLPFTGSDVAGLAAIGAGAALAGVVMVRQSRKTRATAWAEVQRVLATLGLALPAATSRLVGLKEPNAGEAAGWRRVMLFAVFRPLKVAARSPSALADGPFLPSAPRVLRWFLAPDLRKPLKTKAKRQVSAAL